MSRLQSSSVIYFMMLIVLFIGFSLNSIASENTFISVDLNIQKTVKPATSSMEFSRTDNGIKWFDNGGSSESNVIIELSVAFPRQININYRNHFIQGIHTGEALREVCIFISCFWVSGSLIPGLVGNREIHYQINNNEIWIEKSFYINDPYSLTVTPLFGINILPAIFTIKGEGGQETRSGILPIPFWGVNLSKKLSRTVNISSELHHFKYNTSAWGLMHYVYQVGIHKRLSKNFNLSIGYTKRRLYVKYNKNSTDAKFNLDAHSPFITITARF